MTDPEPIYIHRCKFCGATVDLTKTLTECSPLAKWGALNVIAAFGTICDPCYKGQERVR